MANNQYYQPGGNNQYYQPGGSNAYYQSGGNQQYYMQDPQQGGDNEDEFQSHRVVVYVPALLVLVCDSAGDSDGSGNAKEQALDTDLPFARHDSYQREHRLRWFQFVFNAGFWCRCRL